MVLLDQSLHISPPTQISTRVILMMSVAAQDNHTPVQEWVDVHLLAVPTETETETGMGMENRCHIQIKVPLDRQ